MADSFLTMRRGGGGEARETAQHCLYQSCQQLSSWQNAPVWSWGTDGSQEEGGVGLVGGGDEEQEGGAVAGQAEGGPDSAEGEVPCKWLKAENVSFKEAEAIIEQSYKKNHEWNPSYKFTISC